MHPTTPIDAQLRTVAQLAKAMLQTGFQGRKLAEAVETWTSMAHNDVTVSRGF